MIIPCNPQLLSPPHDQYYGTIFSRHRNSSTPQENTSISEWFVPSPSSFQSQPRIEQIVQNENNFSLFSTSYTKLIEELKNHVIGSTSHAKVNKMYDEKGKRPVEFDSHDQEFSNINWISDLLVDEFEGRNL